jgi:hypothetical protein
MHLALQGDVGVAIGCFVGRVLWVGISYARQLGLRLTGLFSFLRDDCLIMGDEAYACRPDISEIRVGHQRYAECTQMAGCPAKGGNRSFVPTPFRS